MSNNYMKINAPPPTLAGVRNIYTRPVLLEPPRPRAKRFYFKIGDRVGMPDYGKTGYVTFQWDDPKDPANAYTNGNYYYNVQWDDGTFEKLVDQRFLVWDQKH